VICTPMARLAGGPEQTITGNCKQRAQPANGPWSQTRPVCPLSNKALLCTAPNDCSLFGTVREGTGVGKPRNNDFTSSC
jgi:hypothetical protein